MQENMFLNLYWNAEPSNWKLNVYETKTIITNSKISKRSESLKGCQNRLRFRVQMPFLMMCEHFKSFRELLDVAQFSFLDCDFQK